MLSVVVLLPSALHIGRNVCCNEQHTFSIQSSAFKALFAFFYINRTLLFYERRTYVKSLFPHSRIPAVGLWDSAEHVKGAELDHAVKRWSSDLRAFQRELIKATTKTKSVIRYLGN